MIGATKNLTIREELALPPVRYNTEPINRTPLRTIGSRSLRYYSLKICENQAITKSTIIFKKKSKFSKDNKLCKKHCCNSKENKTAVKLNYREWKELWLEEKYFQLWSKRLERRGQCLRKARTEGCVIVMGWIRTALITHAPIPPVGGSVKNAFEPTRECFHHWIDSRCSSLSFPNCAWISVLRSEMG